ncbi:MAG: hypothetical protein HY821_22495 [Acidobacteria bacterium]|nr:hypothetical protein [Acidobacteriota bacterium]
MRRAGILIVAFLAGGLLQGQSYRRDFQRNHVSAGLGFAMPGYDLENYYQTAFAWSVNYGYRPAKYLQLDVGYDGAYNAAGVDMYIPTLAVGYVKVRDFQTFIPMGGRVVLPLAGGRVEIYGGGGGAYARTGEYLRQPSQYWKLECPYCEARDGWGYYALLGASVAVDRGQHFRLGATTKVYRVETSGAPVGTTPAITTNDQWVNTYFGLTFSF